MGSNHSTSRGAHSRYSPLYHKAFYSATKYHFAATNISTQNTQNWIVVNVVRARFWQFLWPAVVRKGGWLIARVRANRGKPYNLCAMASDLRL